MFLQKRLQEGVTVVGEYGGLRSSVISWLIPWIIPVGLIGAVIGVTLAFMSVRRLKRASVFPAGSDVSSDINVNQRERALIVGFAFVPLLVAMIWVCVLHLRAPSPDAVSERRLRVDSAL